MGFLSVETNIQYRPNFPGKNLENLTELPIPNKGNLFTQAIIRSPKNVAS